MKDRQNGVVAVAGLAVHIVLCPESIVMQGLTTPWGQSLDVQSQISVDIADSRFPSSIELPPAGAQLHAGQQQRELHQLPVLHNAGVAGQHVQFREGPLDMDVLRTVHPLRQRNYIGLHHLLVRQVSLILIVSILDGLIEQLEK